MGFTTEENMVRVDFFKPSGKWYATEAVRWTHYFSINTLDDTGQPGMLPEDAFLDSLKKHLWNKEHGRYRYGGMTAVCLTPYHEHSYPLMTKVPENT